MACFEYPTRKSIKTLCQDLNLRMPDTYEQDWEYVIVDETRIEEFINYYQNNCLDSETKFTLMIIIIGSFDDAIASGLFDVTAWNKARKLLTQDINLHMRTIEYWSCGDKDIEDCFNITPLIREIEIFKE
jgi:hypothetical protein